MKIEINSFIFMICLLFSCGKDITVPNTLEKQNNITMSESKNILASGIIIKSSETILKYENNTYNISKYSSQLAKQFIEELPQGESSVQFEGEINESEIILIKIY